METHQSTVFHNCHLTLFRMDYLRVTILFPFRSFRSSSLPSTPYHVSSTDHRRSVRKCNWNTFKKMTTVRLSVALERGLKHHPVRLPSVQPAQQLQHQEVLVGTLRLTSNRWLTGCYRFG